MPPMLRSGAKDRDSDVVAPTLRTPRADRPPVDQRDYDDRHETRATSDDDTLRRYVRLRWHQVMQHLVSMLGVTMVVIGGYLVCLWTGLASPHAALFMLGVLGLALVGVKGPAAVQAIRQFIR